MSERAQHVRSGRGGGAPPRGIPAGESGRRDLGPLVRETGNDSGLRATLDALSTLVTGQLDLAGTLVRIAEFAVSAIPGADGAGITLTAAHDADNIVASAPFVAELEAIQGSVEQGPGVLAECEARTVYSPSLTTDDRWPRFASQVAPLAVHSALAIPLRTVSGVLGVMNLYAHPRDAFDEHAWLAGEQFATPASVAVSNAQVLDRARRLVLKLQGALAHRAVIDRAIGILRGREGCSADGASDLLRAMSREQDRELRTVAEGVIEDAVRQARGEPADDLALSLSVRQPSGRRWKTGQSGGR